MISYLLLILGLALTTGCQSMVEIITIPPGSEVLIGDRSVGKSPVTLDQKSLSAAKTNAGYLLTLRQSEQDDILVLVPEKYGTIKLTLNLRPYELANQTALATDEDKQSNAAGTHLSRRKRLDQDSADFLRQQTRIFEGEPGDKSVLQRLRADRPAGGGAVFLEAMTLYLEGNEAPADAALKKAAELNAADVDVRVILEQIRQKSIKKSVNTSPKKEGA